MKEVKIKKVIIALLMVSVTHMALGSFTGTTKRKLSSLYSLKNFNKHYNKKSSIYSLKSGFEFKGSRFVSEQKEPNGDLTVNSMMRYESGNTTYIYPYKHKVAVPKFKTPSAPALR
jgi:hypothetical protein